MVHNHLGRPRTSILNRWTICYSCHVGPTDYRYYLSRKRIDPLLSSEHCGTENQNAGPFSQINQLRERTSLVGGCVPTSVVAERCSEMSWTRWPSQENFDVQRYLAASHIYNTLAVRASLHSPQKLECICIVVTELCKELWRGRNIERPKHHGAFEWWHLGRWRSQHCGDAGGLWIIDRGEREWDGWENVEAERKRRLP